MPAHVDFGYRQWNAITFPRFAKDTFGCRGLGSAGVNRTNIRVSLPSIGAVKSRRIELEFFVEKTTAQEIMVDPEYIRCASVVLEPVDLAPGKPVFFQVGIQ